jgi:hypothetical protein
MLVGLGFPRVAGRSLSGGSVSYEDQRCRYERLRADRQVVDRAAGCASPNGYAGLQDKQFFILVATAIEAAGVVAQFAPLVLLGSGPHADALPAPQLDVLVSLPVALSDASYDVYTVFFGLDILCLAYLALRSRFLPRTIGILLAIDGLAYLVYSFSHILRPGFAANLVPWIQLPGRSAKAR